MGTELMNIEAFKGGPAPEFAVLNQQDESLSDGIGSSYGVINYKGKVWSIRHRGEQHIFTRPDDGSPSSFIDVVILQQARNKSKSYFKAYDPNGTSQGERPICASLDGITPDTDVQVPQSTHCSTCPRNAWKTDANGRKSRECQDYKRLAVLLLPNQTKQLFGEPLIEPVFLRVPPASLNGLGMMGDQMKAQGYHFSTYITRISFDPTVSHPQMVFKAIQPLTKAEAPVVLPLRDDPLCSRIIGADRPAVTAAVTAPQPAQQLPPGQAQPQPQQEVIPPAKQAPATQGTIATGFGDADPSPKTLTLAPDPAPVGFGVAGATQAPQASPPPTSNAVSDTGPATESDAEMDARIAALMPA